MKKLITNLNWKELFFPVLRDINDINEVTDTTIISNNNWTLANDKVQYKKILDLIQEKRSQESSDQNVIIVE